MFAVDIELRGLAVFDVKSVLLLPTSEQAPSTREIAMVVADGVGAAAEPSKQFANSPYPTKSTMEGPAGHTPVRGTVEFTRATFPVEPSNAVLPVASGVGRLIVPSPAPAN